MWRQLRTAASISKRSTGRFCTNTRAVPAEYKAGLDLAIARGWLVLHESGTYVKFTQAGRGAVRLMAKGWLREFDDPIELPNGRKAATLRDAALYITKLPKAEQQVPEWETAAEVLMLVGDHGLR